MLCVQLYFAYIFIMMLKLYVARKNGGDPSTQRPARCFNQRSGLVNTAERPVDLFGIPVHCTPDVVVVRRRFAHDIQTDIHQLVGSLRYLAKIIQGCLHSQHLPKTGP
ncbi:hypothetical protein ACP26L_26640 [Paenibacillus sp. S-38]|uniref:hypothetical protein n=1 Tax=Paenibacillus sp. S-38 TaxID=3416710 RepID=UPI003CF99E4A